MRSRVARRINLSFKMANFELRHVFGGRKPAAAGDFVAGIEEIRIQHLARIFLLIEAGAIRDDGESIVCLSLFHVSQE